MLTWHLNNISNTEELICLFYFIVHSAIVFQDSFDYVYLVSSLGHFSLMETEEWKTDSFPYCKVVGKLGQLNCHH